VLKSVVTWFFVLAAACILGPYLLRIRPTRRSHWIYLAVTIGFLAWMLLFMAPVRSR
jgi:hypothetical protein